MRQRTLIIMLKEPRPGRVKTRLGRDIGLGAAAWWYRQHTRALLRKLRDPRWTIVLAVAPDVEGLKSRVWPHDLPRMIQGRGDIGARMKRALGRTHGPTLLIGSDIPSIRKSHIVRAFRRLRPGGSVIGPAEDGGFWLVGLDHPNRPSGRLFDNVRWSSAVTLRDTLPTLPTPIAIVDTLSDVDMAADLLLGKNIPGKSGGAAPPQ